MIRLYPWTSRWRKDHGDKMKKSILDCRRIILQLVSSVLWAFFAMLSFDVEFRLTFQGFGDPSSALTWREHLIILILFLLPFSIMVSVYISNIIYLYKRKVRFRRYLQVTFFALFVALLSIGFVWFFATNFPDIWILIMDVTLDFINIFTGKG